MKSYLEQLLIPDEEYFLLKRNQMPVFTAGMHHHREIEIKYMVSGTGTAYIGDAIYNYGPKDLVLIGPHIPHFWVSDSHFAQHNIVADCFYIQFAEDFMGDALMQKLDTQPLRKMFLQSRGGLRFFGNTVYAVEQKLLRLQASIGLQRFLLFMDLLHHLSSSHEYLILNQVGRFQALHPKEDAVLQRIYSYIHSHYDQDITLEQVASIAQMRKEAFCAYFKKRTLKTFTDFVNELRIHKSIKLVKEDGKNISEAAYASGYNNLSYYNRKFKEIMKTTPKKYMGKV